MTELEKKGIEVRPEPKKINAEFEFVKRYWTFNQKELVIYLTLDYQTKSYIIQHANGDINITGDVQYDKLLCELCIEAIEFADKELNK